MRWKLPLACLVSAVLGAGLVAALGLQDGAHASPKTDPILEGFREIRKAKPAVKSTDDPLVERSRAMRESEAASDTPDNWPVGSFNIYISPLMARDIYLLNTRSGESWVITTDPVTNAAIWSKVHVQ